MEQQWCLVLPVSWHMLDNQQKQLIILSLLASEQKLSSSAFTNLIGLDQHGWALSHQGLLWHNGMAQAYLPRPMEALRPFLIGLELDADARTLSYTIDNQSMGIAFRNIPTDFPIYPAVSSTSAQSTMILKHRCKSCSTLHDNCLKVLRSTELRNHLDHRWLPRHLAAQLVEWKNSTLLFSLSLFVIFF